MEEGCLSIAGLKLRTKRKSHVILQYEDINGKTKQHIANGVEAVCIQHEIDHLDGVLIAESF